MDDFIGWLRMAHGGELLTGIGVGFLVWFVVRCALGIDRLLKRF